MPAKQRNRAPTPVVQPAVIALIGTGFLKCSDETKRKKYAYSIFVQPIERLQNHFILTLTT
jgi:hypothetical protein